MSKFNYHELEEEPYCGDAAQPEHPPPYSQPGPSQPGPPPQNNPPYPQPLTNQSQPNATQANQPYSPSGQPYAPSGQPYATSGQPYATSGQPYSPSSQPNQVVSPLMVQPGLVQPINAQPSMVQPINVQVITGQLPQQIQSVPQNSRDWKSGICDCFDDCCSCCLGFLFPPCYASHVASRMGENCCTPCFVGIVPLRTKIRVMNGIMGTVCKDGCCVLWCYPCVLCQMARELNHLEVH